MIRSFLKCAMLVMLMLGMATSAVHAGEFSVCVDAPAAFEQGHTMGDGDEVPADAGKGYPHHHAGCHCHQQADVDNDLEQRAILRAVTEPLASHNSFVRLIVHDPALRPPIA